MYDDLKVTPEGSASTSATLALPDSALTDAQCSGLPWLEQTFHADFLNAEPDAEAESVEAEAVGHFVRPFRMSVPAPSPYDVAKAVGMDLSLHAASPAAMALCDAVEASVLAWEAGHRPRKRGRKPAEAKAFRVALEAILGGVLRPWGRPKRQMAYRTTDRTAFTGCRVSFRNFDFLILALDKTDLVKRWKVRKKSKNPEDWKASRFWPGQTLLDTAEGLGVSPDTIRADFRRDMAHQHSVKPPKVTRPIRLKRIANRANALEDEYLPFDQSSPVPLALRNEVLEHNAFASGFDVTGCAPPRWHRVFHGDWKLGGRWYSVGPMGFHYQSMSEGRRIADIRINGEPVAELDMKACNLTLAHGALGLPAPEGDPYDVGADLPRAAVKVFINASIGNGSPLSRWPDDHLKAMTDLGHPTPIAISGPVLARYSFLRDKLRLVAADFLDVGITPAKLAIHRLTWLEAAIITDVMRALRKDGILSLPMHDGLIVPASAAQTAHNLLREAGQRVAGVGLTLTVDTPCNMAPMT